VKTAGWVLVGYLAAAAGILLAGSFAALPPRVEMWPGSPRFDAAAARRQAARLAEGFPYRPTGSSGAEQAAGWLAEEFRALGLRTGIQRGTALLNGRRVPLLNVYAVSPGRRDETVVVVANFDMAPTSYQAASDTAAGVGVLLELARLFAREGHERTFVFFAPDGEEWGMLGARLFAFDPPVGSPLVASVVVEDLAIGRLVRLTPTMTGQFRGYTPHWLREVARAASRAEGIAFEDPPLVLEYADRAVLIPATDQGPLLAAGIPSIELTTDGDQPVLQDEIYHAPGDLMPLVRVDSFHTFGRIAERMVRTLDTVRIPREEEGVRLPDGRVLSGWPLRLAQTGIFLPLLAAAILTIRRESWVAGFAETLRRFAVFLGVYGSVRLLPALGLVPGYELYPPPPKHPLLHQPEWLPFAIPLLAGLLLGLLSRWAWPGRAPGPAERRAGALLVLTALALGVLWENPFTATTFLLLPAWLWVWVAPGSGPRIVLNVILLAAGWAVAAVLIEVQTGLLFGAHLPWYFLLGTAYGQFTPALWLPTLALIALWTQLIQVGMGRKDSPPGPREDKIGFTRIPHSRSFLH